MIGGSPRGSSLEAKSRAQAIHSALPELPPWAASIASQYSRRRSASRHAFSCERRRAARCVSTKLDLARSMSRCQRRSRSSAALRSSSALLRRDPLFLLGTVRLDDPGLDLAEDMRQALLELPGGAVAPVRLVAPEDPIAVDPEVEAELTLRVRVVGTARVVTSAVGAPAGRDVAEALYLLLPRAAFLDPLLVKVQPEVVSPGLDIQPTWSSCSALALAGSRFPRSPEPRLAADRYETHA